MWREFKEQNSRAARQRLIESYQPLVFKIASRLCSREELLLDLVQEGTVGLIEAVESYLPAQGVKFSTFAQFRIRGRMIDSLRRQRTAKDMLELALQEDEFEALLSRTADGQVNIEDEIEQKLIHYRIDQAIGRLNTKEQKVIRDLYLLDKEPIVSAQEMQVSISYFYKLQKKALQRLRGMLAKFRAEMKTSG